MSFGRVTLFAVIFLVSAVARGGKVTRVHCGPILDELFEGGLRGNYQKFLDVKFREVPFITVADLTPQLREHLQKTKEDFAKDPSATMGHVLDGVVYRDTKNGGHRLQGGMHTIAGRGKLLLAQMADLKLTVNAPSVKQAVLNHQAYVLKHPFSHDALRMKKLGLDPHRPEDVVVSIFASHTAHQHPFIEPNGVVRMRFGRALFPARRWKESVLVAANGRAPVGAKTFFPGTWSAETIASAIGKILSDDKTRVLSLVPTSDTHRIRSGILEGEFNDVYVNLAVAGGKLNSAYPSWVQNHREESVREIMRQRDYYRYSAYDRIDELVDELWHYPNVALEDGIQIYLGKRPQFIFHGHHPLTDEMYEQLNFHLNPAMRPYGIADRPDPAVDPHADYLYDLGGSIQDRIEQYLIHTRIMLDVDQLTKPTQTH